MSNKNKELRSKLFNSVGSLVGIVSSGNEVIPAYLVKSFLERK